MPDKRLNRMHMYRNENFLALFRWQKQNQTKWTVPGLDNILFPVNAGRNKTIVGLHEWPPWEMAHTETHKDAVGGL